MALVLCFWGQTALPVSLAGDGDVDVAVAVGSVKALVCTVGDLSLGSLERKFLICIPRVLFWVEVGVPLGVRVDCEENLGTEYGESPACCPVLEKVDVGIRLELDLGLSGVRVCSAVSSSRM